MLMLFMFAYLMVLELIVSDCSVLTLYVVLSCQFIVSVESYFIACVCSLFCGLFYVNNHLFVCHLFCLYWGKLCLYVGCYPLRSVDMWNMF
jgi:hypothetical protein